MQVRVSKWGDSLALRLPQAAVESVRVHQGQQVEWPIQGDRLELRAARPRYRLADLVREITPEDQPEPIDLPQVGAEAL
jgi:antitoxin MazE